MDQESTKVAVIDGQNSSLANRWWISGTDGRSAVMAFTPAGGMMMRMVGALAEFQQAMIRERTSAGLAAASAEGRIGEQNATPRNGAKS
jgi:DNA invertase Pin-like site-specific DNA recombinase